MDITHIKKTLKAELLGKGFPELAEAFEQQVPNQVEDVVRTGGNCPMRSLPV